MFISVQQILDPRGVLESSAVVTNEDAMYAPAVSRDLSAIVCERDTLRLKFNYRALAYFLQRAHARDNSAWGGRRGGILKADKLEQLTRHAPRPVALAAAQCVRDLTRMKAEGFDPFMATYFEPVEAVHMNQHDESVVCNLWGENLMLVHPKDIANKNGSFYDLENGPRLKQNARVFALRPGNIMRFADMLNTACDGVWHRHYVTSTPAISLQGHMRKPFLP